MDDMDELPEYMLGLGRWLDLRGVFDPVFVVGM
jgi:hypothetical protein